MHDELPLVRQALDAGASGLPDQKLGAEVLIEAVRRILDGHAYIEQALATELAYTRSDQTLAGHDPARAGNLPDAGQGHARPERLPTS